MFRAFTYYLKSLNSTWNYLKLLNYLRIIFFDFFSENIMTFLKKYWTFFFLQYIRNNHLRHQNIKTTIKQYTGNKIVEILEKYFKPTTASVDDMDKSEEKKSWRIHEERNIYKKCLVRLIRLVN